MFVLNSPFGDRKLIVFGLIFVLAGLGVGCFYFSMLGNWFDAQQWVKVPCFIESSTLQDHMEVRHSSTSPVDTLMNEAMATYRYEFNGRVYKGNQVALIEGADNFGDFQIRVADILREYQNSGRPYRCFVNPKNPGEAVIFREARWTLLLFMSLFPLLFPLVGGLTSFFAWRKLSEQRRFQALLKRYPDEPWRWKPEWSGKWIHPKDKRSIVIWSVVAGWMTLIWGPLMYALLVDSDVSVSEPVTLLGFLPILPWTVATFGTLRRVLHRRYGQILLHVESPPVTPGSTLEAYLAIPHYLKLGNRAQVQVEVRCVKESRVQFDTSTIGSRKIVWSDHVLLPLSEATREARGSRLALSMDIPEGLPAMPLELAEFGWYDTTQHVWELELKLKGKGLPVKFDLPVFQTEAVEDEAFTEDAAELSDSLNLDADELTLHLASRQIAAMFDDQQYPVSFDLSPDRFAKVRLFLILFNIAWSGVAVVLFCIEEIPRLFPMIWGVSSLIIWGAIILFFRSKHVKFTTSGIEISWRLGSWKGQEKYARKDLVQFLFDSNLAFNATHYYRMQMETIFGKKVTILDGITNKVVMENLRPLLESWRNQT